MLLKEAVIKERITTVNRHDGKSFLMPWIEFTEPATGANTSIFKAEFKDAEPTDVGAHYFIHVFEYGRHRQIDLHYEDPEERNLALITLRSLFQ